MIEDRDPWEPVEDEDGFGAAIEEASEPGVWVTPEAEACRPTS